LQAGQDPIHAKRVERGALTFGEFADQLLADTIGPGLKNEKHLDQWKMTLREYAAPLRPLPLAKITTDDVLGVLKPIWQTKNETASRLRGRIERILDAAKAKGLRTGDNPARWRGHLKELLPKRQRLARGHHAAIKYEDMPAFMATLRTKKSIPGRALEFTVLTAARTGETIGTTWGEIDLDAKLWSVPASRMKAKREHEVPLSDRALEILRSVRPQGEINSDAPVFPSGDKLTKPLSNMAMLKLLSDMQGKGVTVHGFRSSFRDWAGDETSFPRDVVEAALAHVIENKTEAAYRRGTALAKRRELMDAWAMFLGSR
jgi:integrase